MSELTITLFENAKGMSSLVDELSGSMANLRCAIKNGYEHLIRNCPTSFDGYTICDIKEYEKILKENLEKYAINLDIKMLYDDVMSYYKQNKLKKEYIKWK